jgi:hypothetical protein
MRRSSALAVVLTVCTIFVGLSSSARAEGSAEAATVQPKDWITLHSSSAVTPVVDHSWSSHPNDQRPVLLPLPAEGWVGALMVLSIVIYCGVRRARILAIR